MKTKTVALLIAAVTVVAVTGIGNAFAYSWTTTSDSSNDGTEFSYYSGSSNWNHWITQNIPASNGATLTWGNKWHNGYSSPVYYGWQWGAGYASGSTYKSPDTIRPGSDDRTRDVSFTVNLPYIGYTDAVNENHIYSLNNVTWYGTDFHYDQKYTRSS